MGKKSLSGKFLTKYRRLTTMTDGNFSTHWYRLITRLSILASRFWRATRIAYFARIGEKKKKTPSAGKKWTVEGEPARKLRAQKRFKLEEVSVERHNTAQPIRIPDNCEAQWKSRYRGRSGRAQLRFLLRENRAGPRWCTRRRNM